MLDYIAFFNYVATLSMIIAYPFSYIT